MTSRREFIHSAAALGTGLAAGAALAPRLASAAAARPVKLPPSTPGGTRAAGATVNPAAYGMTNWVAAAKLFDSWIGTPMATVVQKAYLREGMWPSRVPPRIATLSAAGVRFLISVKPRRAQSAAEQGRLAAYLKMLQSAGFTFDVCLWQECSDRHYFPRAADYASYVAFYGPVVTSAGVSLVYDGAGFDMAECVAYYPGDGPGYAFSAVCCDFYGSAWKRGQRLDGLIAAAGGKLTGLGEWGDNAGPSAPLSGPDFTAYCDYLASTFAPLANRYDLIYYDSDAVRTQRNTVTGVSDPKVPGIRVVAAAMAAQSQAARA